MIKKVILAQLFITAFFTINSQSLNTGGSMESAYTSPMVEEAPRNIILQNKCGNRATLMFFEDMTEIQFIYKPNADRRKEYRARNFSNRDNYTELFSQFRFPQIKESYITDWDYDPFFTCLSVESPWNAKGLISIINLADENAFAITSRAPLLIAIKPHQVFDVKNGLLTETFVDRGEEIVSFIKFNSMEENRFRVTRSGEYILQIFENEVILVGGEENLYQVERLLKKFEGTDREELIRRNEAIVGPAVDKGNIKFNDRDFQEVLDLNKRIIYSGIDYGGACFGALNRIYYLIWVRDGSMTSAQMARAGNPELIKTWTKFLLNNPSIISNDDGKDIAQFLQIAGSRWTKNEDDGFYYATLSMFTYFQTTGNIDLINGPEFKLLLEVIDKQLEKLWNDKLKMVISDTRGETPLKSNPYFGYDVVNGNFEHNDHHLHDGEKVISSAASLYNMVNTYNLLKMAVIMLSQSQEPDTGRAMRYEDIARAIQSTIITKFVSPKGYLYSEYILYDDGSDFWQPFAKGADYWEYTWAVSTGPFFPTLDLQLKSARMVPAVWPKIRSYGYCPWNTLSRMLYEFGMSSKEYKEMLSDEVSEAVMLTNKYPMKGALTEYNTAIESWRGLPFSASSFFFTISAQILQSLPMGIAVRASLNVDTIENFQFRLSYFDAIAVGKGDVPGSWKLNGQEMPYCLQIPESKMRFGRNKIVISRTEINEQFRLYSSSAQLLDYKVNHDSVHYEFYSPVDTDVVFENITEGELIVIDEQGKPVLFTSKPLVNTGMTQLQIPAKGSFRIDVTLKTKK